MTIPQNGITGSRCQHHHMGGPARSIDQCVLNEHHGRADFDAVPTAQFHRAEDGRVWHTATPTVPNDLLDVASNAYSDVFEHSRRTRGDHRNALRAALAAAMTFLPGAAREVDEEQAASLVDIALRAVVSAVSAPSTPRPPTDGEKTCDKSSLFVDRAAGFCSMPATTRVTVSGTRGKSKDVRKTVEVCDVCASLLATNTPGLRVVERGRLS